MSRWKDKNVMVTGGSAGLGLEIARVFGTLGAKSIIVGRDVDRLRATCQQLTQANINCDWIVADVTDKRQAEDAIYQITNQHQHLDVLVNNVGKSIRTDILQTDVEQYRDFMDTNFFSAVNCTQYALPLLEKSSGHLVNIGSLSSKTPWPFLGPYTASKFALAGYTHQLRLEGPRNVHYLLVCPGPIARDDSGQRYEGQINELPDAAGKPAAGAKLKKLDPAALAEKIVRCCERRKPELVLPWKTKILFALSSASPRIGDWLLRRFVK